MSDRICVQCQSFWIDEGEADWSEVTPGADASIECSKGHWTMYNNDGGHHQFRLNIAKAATCADFQEAKDE